MINNCLIKLEGLLWIFGVVFAKMGRWVGGITPSLLLALGLIVLKKSELPMVTPCCVAMRALRAL